MKYVKPLLATAITTMLLTGCGPSSVPSVSLPEFATPKPAASPSALSSLVPDSVISKEELELRDYLDRPLNLKFPLKVGILLYQVNTPLKAEDQQTLLETSQQEVKASDMVTSVISIPSSLVQSNASIDTIRQLGARFQVDMILIISANHSFQKSDSQPLSFWDTFTDRSYWESRTTVEAIALNIFSGTFLGSFRTVGKQGPQIFEPVADNFDATTYDFQKQTVQLAFEQLKTEFLQKLTDTQKKLAEMPEPTPTPSPTPSTGESSAPTPSPTPSTGEPSFAPTPTPTPSV